jgi:hypothetical protein
MQLSKLLHNGCGLIRRAVVDDQDLGMPTASMNATQDLVQSCVDPGAFVVSGDNDTD